MLWQPSGFPHLYYIHPCQKCQIHFDRNCPGETVCVFAEGFPMIQPGSARLPRPIRGLAMTNLLALRHRIRAAKPTACKALNPRKGDAASVRRQSRQRLRSERRYRRNWSVRFIDALYELQVPSRDCHVALLLAMTHQAGAAAHQCPSAVELPCTRRSLSAAAFFSRTADLYGSPQPTEKYPKFGNKGQNYPFYATRICHTSQLVKHYFFEKGIDLFLICVMLFL